MNNDTQNLYNIIAILTKKLGGKVTITQAEIENPPRGTATRDKITGAMSIEVVEEVKP